MTDTYVRESWETHRLAEMTWPEVRDARDRAPLAIVPTGSCEQHGQHMALQTDTVRAERVADMIAERIAPRAVVTPTLNVGVSGHHMQFPGTLTLDPVTFGQVLYEVVKSVHRHGWRTVFVLNGHGGNNAATGVAVARLQAELPGLRLAYSGITPVVNDLGQSLFGNPLATHASEVETSQSLYVDPSLVRQGLLDAPVVAEARRYPRVAGAPGVRAPLGFHDVSEDGATGDPTRSTREAGEKLIEAAVDRLAGFLNRFIDHEKEA